MKQLSSICSDLTAPGKVQELLGLLQDQDSANISTFEFLTSGAVHQLRDFLAGADLMKGKTKVHVDSQKLLQRLHAFWEVAMAQGKDGAPPMQSLVCAQCPYGNLANSCPDANTSHRVYCSCAFSLVTSFPDRQLTCCSMNSLSLSNQSCSW